MRDWQAVIFDVDGLMLDTEILARRAWDRAMADWHLTIPDSTYAKLVGRRVDDVGKIIAEEMGAQVPFDEIARRKNEYLDESIASNGIPIKEGLLELLDWLDERRISKAVASSTHRPVLLRKLALTGLVGRFTVMVCGDEIAQGKPAPDIFLAAARHLQVAPSECIVLEDSEPGIIAANAAGMIPILVPDQIKPSAEAVALAFRVLPSLHDVKELLADNWPPGPSSHSRLTNTSS